MICVTVDGGTGLGACPFVAGASQAASPAAPVRHRHSPV